LRTLAVHTSHLAMDCPSSLPQHVKARAFRSGNGELGILPEDAPAFLDACRQDGVEVLGWELWVVDHEWDFETGLPVPLPGVWMGGIPMRGEPLPAIVHGETAEQFAEIDFQAEVEPAWQPHIRVNFTLAD
jgi:hypothetical protein